MKMANSGVLGKLQTYKPIFLLKTNNYKKEARKMTYSIKVR